MAILFIEPGGDATGGFDFYSSTIGSISVDAAAAHTGAYGLKAAAGGFYAAALISTTAVTSKRVSFWFKAVGSLSTSTKIYAPDGGGNALYYIGVNSSLQLQILLQSTVIATGTTTLSFGQWYHITISQYNQSTTVNDCKVFLGSNTSPEVAASNQTLSTTDISGNYFGWCSSTTPAACDLYVDDIYIDDANTLDNVGAVQIANKEPASLNTNNFDTLGGSGTNRYDRVSDLPASDTNYLAHLGATDVQENFGLQSISTGVDLTGSTISLRQAWIRAKRGEYIGTGTPKNTNSVANKDATTLLSCATTALKVGDLIVVALADQMGSTAPTIADSLNNTWTALSGPTTNTIRASKWYSIVTTAGSSTTITATFSAAGTSKAMVIAVWDKDVLASSSQLDKDIANTNDSTSPYDCPSTGTLVQADEIVLGFAFAAGNANFAAGNGTLTVADASIGAGATTNSSVAISHRVVAATTAIAPQFTLGTSRTGIVGTASFKTILKVAGTPKIMDNGTETGVTLTTTPAFYTLLTTTSSYPNNAAGIGMRSSGAGGADTYFYEGGTMIVYVAGAPSAPPIPKSGFVLFQDPGIF